MSCPIGLSAVSGKKPMEIAVSIAAEIISLYQNVEQQSKPAVKLVDNGVHWRELKQLINES
jgi:xanthine dehydrogenase accessory factor